FSSRRRHTRSKRDWSSDVCSSDLRYETLRPDARHQRTRNVLAHPDRSAAFEKISRPPHSQPVTATEHEPEVARRSAVLHDGQIRSEERRVGKECRTERWQTKQRKN